MFNYGLLMLSDSLLAKFAEVLGYQESGNNYAIRTPALGRYQFTFDHGAYIAGKLGLSDFDINEFLSTPGMQDEFFYAHIKDIDDFIKQNNLNLYEGKTVIGKNKFKESNKINRFGLYAGAHLGGKEGLRKFLQKGIDASDSNGTYISDYVSKFSKLMQPAIKENSKILIGSAIVAIILLFGILH